MIGFSNGKLSVVKNYCGVCKKIIISNGIEPVFFKSDYYHYDCCTWDRKTIEPIKNDNKQEEIKAWIRKTKAEIMIKSLKNQEEFS